MLVSQFQECRALMGKLRQRKKVPEVSHIFKSHTLRSGGWLLVAYVASWPPACPTGPQEILLTGRQQEALLCLMERCPSWPSEQT